MIFSWPSLSTKITTNRKNLLYSTYNCGRFAIAFCTALAHGVPLSEVILNQHTMWFHLIKHFEKLEMTPFQIMYVASKTYRD